MTSVYQIICINFHLIIFQWNDRFGWTFNTSYQNMYNRSISFKVLLRTYCLLNVSLLPSPSLTFSLSSLSFLFLLFSLPLSFSSSLFLFLSLSLPLSFSSSLFLFLSLSLTLSLSIYPYLYPSLALSKHLTTYKQ